MTPEQSREAIKQIVNEAFKDRKTPNIELLKVAADHYEEPDNEFKEDGILNVGFLTLLIEVSAELNIETELLELGMQQLIAEGFSEVSNVSEVPDFEFENEDTAEDSLQSTEESEDIAEAKLRLLGPVGLKIKQLKDLGKGLTYFGKNLSVKYLAKSLRNYIDVTLHPKKHLPGPRGFRALQDGITAFTDPEFAAHYYSDLFKKYGKVVMVSTPIGQVVYVADAQLHYKIASEWEEHPRAWPQRQFEGIAGIIIASEGDEQRRLRELIEPHLRRSQFLKHTSAVQEEAQKMLQTWDKEITTEGIALGPEMVKYFSKISARLLAGGADLPEGLGLEIVHLIALFQVNPLGAEYLRTKAYVFDVVKKLLTEPEQKNRGILSVYQKEYKEGRLTLDQAIAEVVGFFNASVETTSNLFSFLIYHLAKDRKRYKKLQNEARAVMNGRTQISADDLKKLPHFFKYIEESGRMYPAVWRQLRQVGEDGEIITVDGHTYELPKHTQLFDIVRHVQTDPEVWGKDAQEFNPEGHMDPEFLASLPKGSFAPWLEKTGSVHICPGMSFAKHEMALSLLHILLHYDDLHIEGEHDPVYGPVLAFPTNVKMKAEMAA